MRADAKAWERVGVRAKGTSPRDRKPEAGRRRSWTASPASVSGALARRVARLAVGVVAIAALGYAVSQAGRLPGALGEAIRATIQANRDATALFYTEVDDWDEWAPYP